jgi:hypothetical protein
MRPDRAPARPQCIRSSGDGGIRTHTVHVLSVATPTKLVYITVEGELGRLPVADDPDTWNPSKLSTASAIRHRAQHSQVTRGGIEPPLTG